MKNMWNERYRNEEFFYGKEPNDFLKDASKSMPKGSKVLCLAEGEGRNAVYLACQGHEVTAIDLSNIGLEKLQHFAKQKNVEIKTEVADLSEYIIKENYWDAIISIWCHLPSSLRQKVHNNCVKGLKNNGVFILEAYTSKQLEFKTGGPSNIDLLMSEVELRKELSGMHFDIIRELEREIHEGAGHNGMSAVVQIMATKK